VISPPGRASTRPWRPRSVLPSVNFGGPGHRRPQTDTVATRAGPLLAHRSSSLTRPGSRSARRA
jgi:hypothetical protein